MAYAATSSTMTSRMIRAAKLEVPLYEEVEADITATNQALLVVVLAAVASGIGAALGGVVGGTNAGGLVGLLVFGILRALIGWAVWSYVVYFVGTRFFGGTATYGELLRTLGFAQSPGVLLILRFVPVLGGLLGIAVAIWVLVTGFVATRQALDIDNTKTVFTILIGFVCLLVALALVTLVVGTIFGLGALVGSLI